jgi:hypothetical protein
MTELLEQALQKVAGTGALPPDKQDRLAEVILNALDDLEWDRQFAESQDVLATLADEGLAEYSAGRTRRLKV